MTARRLKIVTDPYVPKHLLAEWAISRLHDEDLTSVAELGDYVAYGILKDNKPIAVIIYNWFRQMSHGNDMRVIIASDDPSWCLPGMLREIFAYPFLIAGCERLTAVIRDGNKRSLKLCQGLGFKREGNLRRAFNGKTNALMLGMLKSECRWIMRRPAEAKNGKEVFQPAARSRSVSVDCGAAAG